MSQCKVLHFGKLNCGKYICKFKKKLKRKTIFQADEKVAIKYFVLQKKPREKTQQYDSVF